MKIWIPAKVELTAENIDASIYDMNTEYLSPIRQQYMAQTRERILDAAIAGMEKGDVETLTIARVAKEAGVTERTVYRHFQTREELLKAVWPHMQARVGLGGFPETVEALIAAPAQLYPRFDAREGSVRASMYSQAGREVRVSANPARQKAFLARVEEALPQLDDDARRRRAAVVQMIGSSHGWACLKDYWGLNTEEAGRAAEEAIAILLGRDPTDKTQGDTP
jgi:AcrR family transcriptional regulator